MASSRQVNIYVNGQQVANQIKSITAEKQKLTRELGKMIVGSEEYEKKIRDIQKVDGIINAHKNKIRGVEDSWKTITSGATKFLNASAIASAAGLAGITLGAEAAISAIVDTVKETNALRREINQATGAVGDQLDTITVKTKAIATTFNQTEGEVVQAANTLAREFQISYDQAFEAINKGFIQGANNSGQFLENIKEYSTQFRAAGFAAEEFININIRSAQEGIFSDKGLDVIKEFGLRIREQTKAAGDALDNAFGQKFTDGLFKGINDGSISTQKALQLVAKEINNTEVPANKLQTVIADVFGAAGEDAGLRFISTLQDVQGELDAAETAANQYQTAQQELLTANEDLAFAQNELAKSLFRAENGFNITWTKIKTVVIDAIGQIINGVDELPATWSGITAALGQFFDNIKARVSGSSEDIKPIMRAYREAYIEALQPIKQRQTIADELQKQQEAAKAAASQQEINAKAAGKAAERSREEKKKQDEREAKELEAAQKRLTDIVLKFASERTLAQLDEEDRKLEEIRLKYEDGIKLAKALEAKGVKAATTQRKELEEQREEELRAQREAFFQARLAEDAARLQEQTDAELEDFFERAEKKREAQATIDEALREDLLTEREKALQDLDKHYTDLLQLAQENGIDTLDLEIAHRIARDKIIQDFDRKELGDLAKSQQERAELLRQSFSDLGGAISDLLGTIGSESREFVVLQKALTLAQIAIDTAAAISSLTRNSEANPANAVTFGVAGTIQFATGLIRILANIAKAKQVIEGAKQRKHGGFATVRGADDGQLYNAKLIGQPMTGMLDYPHPVLTSSGILANEVGKEYYVSHTDLRNPKVLNHVRAIENITSHRQRMAGGFASTSPAANSQPPTSSTGSDPEMKQLLAINAQFLGRLLSEGVRAEIGNDELLAMQRQIDKLNKVSGGRAR